MLLLLPLKVAEPTRFSLELAASVTSGPCTLLISCLSSQTGHFYVAVEKHYDRGSTQKKEFILLRDSRR